jgi:hypothetical protein
LCLTKERINREFQCPRVLPRRDFSEVCPSCHAIA